MTCEEKLANCDNEYNRLRGEFVDIEREMEIMDQQLNKKEEKIEELQSMIPVMPRRIA